MELGSLTNITEMINVLQPRLPTLPYPGGVDPDLYIPPQRIEDKEGFLNAATIGSASGRNSGVYSNLLAMDSKQRHQWSFGVILAG